ncbi:FAD-binding protein, partial [Endobacter medicaginis]|nr:FAD-binding protein [Endobacter medicaginis]
MSDFVSLLGDVPLTTDAAIVKRKSRDFYWYSPVLKARLDGLSADVLLTPRDEADLLAIAQAARASGTPLT